MGGMKAFVKPGERVLLKVNLLAASTPDSAVVTHPSVVRAVAKAIVDAGGKPIIADSPSREFSKSRLEKVYEQAGLIKLSRELGIDLNYDTRSQKRVIPNAKRLKKSPICRFALDADKIIALPKIKTHSLMMMTLATKIMYGAVPGLTKARYHSRYFRKLAFADMLLDLLNIVPPDLFIMDGVLGMQGDGPMGGTPVEIGVMLAATDAVALDLATCKLLGIESMGVPPLRQAKVRGLWPGEIRYPLLTPEDVKYSGFILPSSAGYLLTGKKRPSKSPIPIEKCTGCGDCVRICPRDAIKLENDKAKIDYSLCIKCYCCHEVCPERAIVLKVLRS
jgi:uncharacterized protein (DUF362 family)/NAD-dependent dihydropyrimidine dehydrogenase PreA subunit